MKTKNEIRKLIFAERRELTAVQLEEKSRSIAAKICALDVYKKCRAVYIYLDCRKEPKTGDIIDRAWADGKKVCVPKIVPAGPEGRSAEGKAAEENGNGMQDRKMIFCPLKSFDELSPGFFGILEPKAACGCSDGSDGSGDTSGVKDKDILVVMPGVAFDRRRHRIGYGGGFYDRFLERHADMHTAALAFDFQVFSEVPCEDNDISPGMLITESELIQE